MRILILILMLFTFAVGSFSDTVHAATHNHTSGHHHLEHNVDADQEPCHSDQEQSHDENGCDDCCCAHSHSMVMSVISTKTLYATKQQNIIASLDDHYSVKLASLKRPPRL